MSDAYRDDLEAALARAEASDREAERLAGETQRLALELAAAKNGMVDLVKRRKLRILAGVGYLVLVVLIGFAYAVGISVGRSDRGIRHAPPPQPRTTTVKGRIVAAGPPFGDWTLDATDCRRTREGFELRLGEDPMMGFVLTTDPSGNDRWTEVLVDHGKRSKILDPLCKAPPDHLERVLHENDDSSYDGYLSLDCTFIDSSIRGQIEFTGCR